MKENARGIDSTFFFNYPTNRRILIGDTKCSGLLFSRLEAVLSLPETHDVSNVEILQTGFFNGHHFSKKDLSDVVQAHSEIGDKLKPFMKLGHDEKQVLLQNGKGYPAAGWITSVRSNEAGDRVLADFRGVPARVKDLMDRKAYGRFSAEILVNGNIGGKVYPKSLRAVAMLGGETPAMTGLKDFIDLYSAKEGEDVEVVYVNVGDESNVVRIFGQEAKPVSGAIVPITGNEPKAKETKKMADENKEEVIKLTSDLKAETEAKDKAITDGKAKDLEIKKYQMDAEKAGRDAKLEKILAPAIAAGKITPALAFSLKALAFSDLIEPDEKGVRTFSYQDGKDEKVIKFSSTMDLFEVICNSMPQVAEFSKDGGAIVKEDKAPDASGEAEQDKLIADTEKYALEHKIEFSEASRVIIALHENKKGKN